MNAKLAVVPLALLLVASVLGVSYAMWSDTIRMNFATNTGEVNVEFSRAYVSDSENVTGIGYNDFNGTVSNYPDVDDFIDGVAVVPGDLDWVELDKDYAWGTAELLDTDGDGDYDTVEVTLFNTYPFYMTWLSVEVHNIGTIPVIFDYYIINGTTLTKYQIGSNALAFIDADNDGEPELVVQFVDLLGSQMEPGDERESSIRIMVLQPAEENSVYKIYIQLVAVQWNESIYQTS